MSSSVRIIATACPGSFSEHVRRPLLTRILLAIAAAWACCAANAAEAADAVRVPNIVVILADDLGYGDLGCYGHPLIKTPNLDRLAQQGMRFTDCHSAGSVCSPSRSAIQTGRTPFRNGVFTWIPEGSPLHLRRSEIALASLLSQAGYDTCHAGKWHLNGQFNKPEQPQPNDHGYHWWLATQNNAAPNHLNPTNFVRNGQPTGLMEGASSGLVVSEAVNWLKQRRDPQKPFFITVCTHEPHAPIESQTRFMEHYNDLPDPEVRQHHGNVTQRDHACGTLLGALDELKLADNTLVIFTSDNGPEGDGVSKRFRGSTGGLRGRKRDMYEGGHRVPGIVRWPGHIQPGSRCEQPVIGSDWFTTICTVTGVKLPTDRTIDGASVVPAFTQAPIERKVPMYWRYHFMPSPMKMALRDGDWKILASAKLDAFELYNLRTDLHERHNLTEMEPAKFAAMKQRLIELNSQIEAEGPGWWRDAVEQSGKAKAPAKAKAKSL